MFIVYNLSGAVLSSGDTTVNKRDSVLALMEFYSQGEVDPDQRITNKCEIAIGIRATMEKFRRG